ncbi:MAG: hypothetical protein K2O31_03750 [Clostridia bacterium]|nr:hypothetical protein [Clostridia bacterium]
MDTQQQTKLDYELTEYGKLLFEYNTLEKKNPLYVSAEKRKANLKSPLFYFIISIPIIMIAWFIASLISATRLEGDERLGRIVLTLGSLIPMGFCCFFVIMIAFGFWGNLYAWKLKGAYNKKEEYIRIYKDYLVIKNDEVISAFDLSKIDEIEVYWGYYVKLISQREVYNFFLEIPKRAVIAGQLARNLGKKLTIAESQRSFEPVCFDSWREFLVGLFFALLAAGVGIGIICMRLCLDVDVPILIGIMFIGGGLMILCGIFSFIPFVKDIITPLMAAAFFIVIPWGLTGLLHEVWHFGEGINAYTIFSPFSCVALVLSSISVLFVVTAIMAIIDYIRYGHKLGKI